MDSTTSEASLRDRLANTDTHLVAFAGDWHANGAWALAALPRLHAQHPDVRVVLHAGDFGIFLERHPHRYLSAVDEACTANGIERILVTPGNHEDWATLDAVFARDPGEAAQVSDHVWVMPRGFRFELGGRTFMSFGGAASVDYHYRVSGVSWWPSEVPTELDEQAAIAGGPVDVLLTHETVDGGTPGVALALAINTGGWPIDALAYSAMSRARVTRVWKAVHPKVLVHGHMHIAGESELADGSQVISLGCDEQLRNIGILDLRRFDWTWIAETPE